MSEHPFGYGILEDGQSEQHTQAGGAKPIHPAILHGDVSAHQRREESPEVNTHIENGKTGIAARIALRIEATHHTGDIGFEETVTGSQETQSEVESVIVSERHKHKPDGHHNAPIDDGIPIAQVFVGNHTPHNRGCIHQRTKCGVDGNTALIGEGFAQMVVKFINNIENQQSPHTVVGKAFPEFGKE